MGWKMWSRFVVFQMFDCRSHKFVLKFILDYILISNELPSYVTDFVRRLDVRHFLQSPHHDIFDRSGPIGETPTSCMPLQERF